MVPEDNGTLALLPSLKQEEYPPPSRELLSSSSDSSSKLLGELD